MKVLLLGNLGNMGKRYEAILKYLQHEVIGLDVGYTQKLLATALAAVDHVIVATPTPTHCGLIQDICEHKNVRQSLHVLCEKPVVKSLVALERVLTSTKDARVDLYCVNQYAHLTELGFAVGDLSSYDYFNHGKDGLHWDCFQVFALARGPVTIDNKSPIWRCWINGAKMNISSMDRAYVDMVKDFLGEKKCVWREDVIKRVTKQLLEHTH